MFDFDKWEEIFTSIRRHKMRTALTALGVFWGIFMLVILLGAGQGLQNGVEYQFRDDATNSIWLRRGTTSKEYRGLPKGRRIEFTNEEYDFLVENFADIEHITGRYYLSGDRIVAYGDQSFSYPIRSVHPGHLHIENTLIQDGRYLNQQDLDEYRKVAVIGRKVKDDLFGGEGDPIGREISIGGIVYKVVGWYEDTGGDNEMRIIYLPITTAQKVYAGTERIHQLMFSTGDMPLEEMQDLEGKVRRMLAVRLGFDPSDRRALYINNRAEDYQQVQSLFFAIKAFVWFVGIGTLLAGVIGVSNIMLIIVKDRTKEIGIRKAMGATPRSIISMVLQEAVFLTALAGYGGMLAGIAVLYGLGSLELDYFRHPQVNIWVAMAAIAVLMLAGALAGLMPAIQAARINPVVAMQAK